METTRTRTCERCTIQVPLDKVKLIPKNNDQNMLVCVECGDYLRQASMSKITNDYKPPIKNVYKFKEQKTILNTPVEKQAALDQDNLDQDPTPNPNKVIKLLSCIRCNYDFKVNRDKAGRLHKVVCPYCGKADKITPSKNKPAVNTSNKTSFKKY
ncbi:MAG TPA: hypothetical protein VJC39_01480 [Candidatus Nanoarchaeia archaeon]|nr:hypothetical protein [Candidatus Nanoarchaeia archaeon]